jgi:hypothetical protein
LARLVSVVAAESLKKVFCLQGAKKPVVHSGARQMTNVARGAPASVEPWELLTAGKVDPVRPD